MTCGSDGLNEFLGVGREVWFLMLCSFRFWKGDYIWVLNCWTMFVFLGIISYAARCADDSFRGRFLMNL
jgi:hypothetical protein